MERKTAVFICSGCGIGEAIDVEKLRSVALEGGACAASLHEALCAEEGQALINKVLGETKASHAVICACSQRVFSERFSWPGVFTERVNLREHVAWCHTPKDVGTQEKAEDYVRMGVAKCLKADLPVPQPEDPARLILVVGGGVTGLRAALFAADAGYDVVLVEKEKELGGFAARLFKTYPHASPWHLLQENPVPALIERVKSHPKIKVYLGRTISRISGAPGKFDVTIGENGDSFRAGAIIVATGFRPYDISKLSHLGGGRILDVVGADQFEEMAKSGALVRPSDNKPVKKVVFIQCAGSRDPNHLPYCSATCCLNSLKQAHYLLDTVEGSEAYILYKDMRTPALYEQYYEAAQQAPGLMLAKADVTSVEAVNGAVRVTAKDTLLGSDLTIDADLVVLAQGKVPNSDQPTLNLTYRKGKELPELKYGFPDSNFICFPYETARTGIYAAGCVRAPSDIAQCKQDAAGAALKAIQCIYAISQGAAVHPRSGDLSYPEFFLQRCTQCKRCTEECPFGTLDEDEKGTPQPNPTRCRRCGVCMGACPERIVSFKDYSVQIIGDMVKSVHVPEEFEEKPRYIGFICENDAYPALDMAGFKRVQYSPLVRFIPVRCLGSVNRVWIADALSRGIDGILLIGCKFGDDYQCHFLKGSELCNKRMENVQEDLNRLALERERIRIVQLAINEYEQLPQIINDFVETVNALGMNPYKGF